jgi:hypothetical protein
MRRIVVVIAALLIVVAPSRGSAASREQRRILSFGPLHLQPKERIVAIEITLTAARFAAINPIPNDWSVCVEGPIGQCTLKATCQHGSSAFSHSRFGFSDHRSHFGSVFFHHLGYSAHEHRF